MKIVMINNKKSIESFEKEIQNMFLDSDTNIEKSLKIIKKK